MCSPVNTYLNGSYTLLAVGNSSDGARTAAIVLFCLVAVMLVVAIAAAVIAGVLFWMGRRGPK